MIPLFQKSKKREPCSASIDTRNSEVAKQSWQWYSPPADRAPVTFCLSTSLHGMRYIGEQKRHICERLFWLSAFLSSTTFAAVLIWTMWKDYSLMPIVTVFNPTEKSINEIPFPAVTICNVNLVQNSTHDKIFTSTLKMATDGVTSGFTNEYFQEVAKILDMTLVCNSVSTFIDSLINTAMRNRVFIYLWKLLEPYMQVIEKHMNPAATIGNMSQPCHKMILNCSWQNSLADCSKLFRSIVTDHGHCCTFNSLPTILLSNKSSSSYQSYSELVQDWEVDKLDYDTLMFTEETKHRKYPLRQLSVGRKSGLSFLLEPDLGEYFCTNGDSDGFVLSINAALDYPRMQDSSISIGTKSEVFVGIRPEITISDQSVKYFPLDKRNCYYADEYRLRFYTVYTYSNCMSECIARETLAECGCVRYYMPRNENDTICKSELYKCTANVIESIGLLGHSSSCSKCLPSCTEIEYHKEITSQRLQQIKMEQLFHEYGASNMSKDVSVVHIYFNTDAVYPKLRKQLTTPSQLISSAGGLLGLCLGFSLLSLLEIFYHATLRVCCNWYRERSFRSDDLETIFVTHDNSSGQKDNEIHTSTVRQNANRSNQPVHFLTSLWDNVFQNDYYEWRS